MNGFIPFQPQGNSQFLEWAKRIHQKTMVERRLLTSPGALTSQTTQGVFTKPRPHIKAQGGGGDLPVWL